MKALWHYLTAPRVYHDRASGPVSIDPEAGARYHVYGVAR